jgi:hypothetical protein
MTVAALLLLALLQNVPPPPPPPPPPIRVGDPAFNLQQLLQSNPRPPRGSISGVVMEMPADRPLAGATVRLQNRNGTNNDILMVATTREDGTFSFGNVTDGTLQLEAERAGYILTSWTNATVPQVRPTSPSTTIMAPIVQLAPGQNITGARLELMKGAVITGRLVDDHGEPLAGAAVQALKTTFNAGVRQRTPVQAVTSNDLGEYRLFMLKPGQYYLSVVPSGMISMLPGREASAIPIYFPGTIDTTQAQPIELSIGQTIEGVNFNAIPTRTHHVSGNIQGTSDPAGVVLSPLNGTTAIDQTVNSTNGSFEFTDVIPGPYMLVARTANAHSMTPLNVRNGDTLGVRVFVGDGFKIPVHVHIEGHGPGDDPDLDLLYFTPRLDAPVPGIESDDYSPFPDGHFLLDLMARDYKIDLTRPTGYYIKSMMLNGVDVLNQGLRVTGSTDGPLEILVSNAVGAVAGTTNGRIAAVVLVPDPVRRSQRPLYRWMTIGGRFKFDDIPPGDYKLFAWAEENGGPWLDPEYLRKYEGLGVPVHVEAGKTATAPATIPIN